MPVSLLYMHNCKCKFGQQTATSFLMRFRLGGSGFKPETSSPLAPYVKGIGELTDLMQKLTSVIEDDLNER